MAPNNSPEIKLEAIKGYGAEVVLCEPTPTERFCKPLLSCYVHVFAWKIVAEVRQYNWMIYSVMAEQIFFQPNVLTSFSNIGREIFTCPIRNLSCPKLETILCAQSYHSWAVLPAPKILAKQFLN